MADPITSLESIQAALEAEVEKFEVIGKASVSLSDSIDTVFAEDSSLCDLRNSENLYNELHINGKEQNSYPLNGEVLSLKTKLEDVSARIKAKEHQITQLESRGGTTQEASVSSSQSLEVELEDLFQQKFEYEVEHLILLKTTETKATEDDQISLFKEQKSLAAKQIQMMQKLKEAEHKATTLKNQAEELEASCQQLLAAEEVPAIIRKVLAEGCVDCFNSFFFRCSRRAFLDAQGPWRPSGSNFSLV